MNIVHITPTLPPAINGLGDFSKILVDNIKEKGFTKNLFFVFNQNQDYSKTKETVIKFDAKNFYYNLAKAQPNTIIIHYVGYAYQKRGLPFFLSKQLLKYKTKHKCKVLIFFHELYSSSSNPFKLPFYTNYFQKILVRSLYNLSFMTFTNCEIYHDLLKKTVKAIPFNNIYTGIYSNIPDHLFDPTQGKRDDRMIVFGSYSRRYPIYKNLAFRDLLKKLKITEVYDIGPGNISFSEPSIQFISKGSLPPTEVAALLNNSRFGAIVYPAEILGKSGIFSAYAAFGLIPINMSINKEKLYDNLLEGKNYFNLETSISEDDYEVIEKEILKWYSTRTATKISEAIEKYLN